MPLSFAKIKIGESYDRPTLAAIWGYKSWSAIGKGVFTPAKENIIVLFVTRHKQSSLPQYEDSLEDGILQLEGEAGHRTDERLIHCQANEDEVHLFYRERHHSPFLYCGTVILEGYERHSSKPSQFTFRLLHPPA